ncbi:MAG: NADH:flavin oxidoreductase [Proteobacteria bacterium]|nr:NADH:flavin oxidoreductase [Pseudomonadota bacterium]
MPELFESTSIASMTLANRFVRSATWEGMAMDDGSVTPRLTQLMVDLAQGGIGLIITSHAYVSREGQAGLKQLGVYGDALAGGLADMAKAVHAAGGRIALQLAHAGDQANTKLSGLASVGPVAHMAGSASSGAGTLSTEGQLPCHALDQAGIAGIAKSFADAAVRAKKAGFDAVQIHAAHGYLLHQFLSSAWNTRADEYGGTLENRAKPLLQVVRAVREAVGPAYPVLAKLDSEDFVPGGFTCEEAATVAAWLQMASVNALELSGGCRQAGENLMSARKGKIRIPDGEVYYREAARIIKSRLSIPLMLVGGIRSFEVASDLVESGVADYISLARPLICEPGLVNRWQKGDRSPALCVSDNACYGPGFAGEGIRCVTFEKKRAHAGQAVSS